MSASTVVPTAEGLEIELYRPQQAIGLLFAIAFMAIGAVNAVAFSTVGKSWDERGASLIGVIFFVVGALFLVQQVAKRVVTVRGTSLLLSRRLGPFAFAREYDMLYIRGLRETVAPAEWEVRPKGAPIPMRPALAFDYGNQTIYFGHGVADLAEVHAALLRVAPSLARTDAAPPLGT